MKPGHPWREPKRDNILWPDGIFITKRPKQQQPTHPPRDPQVSPNGKHPPSPGGYPPSDEETLSPEELQEREALRRSKLVYELMIDKAPAAVVSIFGRKEYEQCAQDVYYFIQSSVCLKQLTFDLLELLLMSAFPEMDSVFQQLQDEKQKSKAGKRFAFVRFIKVDNVDRLVGNLCTLWIGRMHLHANVVHFERTPSQVPRPSQTVRKATHT
nr:Phox-associated domain, sorting nexin [Tanacetum cinerariifolium]